MLQSIPSLMLALNEAPNIERTVWRLTWAANAAMANSHSLILTFTFQLSVPGEFGSGFPFSAFSFKLF
jgi:hypothetical protein